MCFHVRGNVLSEAVMGDVKAGGWRERKETPCVLLCCPPFSAARGLLLEKCLLVPMASFCPFL